MKIFIAMLVIFTSEGEINNATRLIEAPNIKMCTEVLATASSLLIGNPDLDVKHTVYGCKDITTTPITSVPAKTGTY